MKTKKEIKPFKMRVNKENIQKAINILVCYFDTEDVFLNGETILILSNNNILCTRFDIIGYFEDREEPELTYSEFMELHGEEEEVFTKEDMKLAMTWAINLFHTRLSDWTRMEDDEELLTKYLSERTNG